MNEDFDYLNNEIHYHEPLYAWLHITCINTFPKMFYTPKSIVKIGTIDESLYKDKICSICKSEKGIFTKCHESDCKMYFHSECARRINFCFISAPESEGHTFKTN